MSAALSQLLLYLFQISVVSVYVHGIEAAFTANNQDIAIDAVIDDIALKERGNMSVEKFQEFFIAGLFSLISDQSKMNYVVLS